MTETNSRGLLRSMAIIGSAQAVHIVLTVLRAKVVALLLGPSGIGLLSMLNSLREMTSLGAGLGLSSSGVRELSHAKRDMKTLSRVRRVLLGALLIQGLAAMVLIWIARVPVAEWLLGNADHATEVGLVGVAVFFFLLGSSQTTLLQGMRRIGDLGRVTVWSTLFGTLTGLAAVVLLGQAGLIWLILAPIMASVLVAVRYTRRLPPPDAGYMTPGEIWRAWWPMVRLGVVFMIGLLVTTGTLLLVRVRITQELGLDAAGYFAASWSITMIYVGFLLQAIGTDYFPRLTEVIHDHEAAARLMNDHMQLALALGGPILLLLIGCAPWLIRLLYSPAFDPAITILQWQTVGNFFKLGSWALGFSFVAAARPMVFLFLQINFNVLFLVLLFFGFPLLGLTMAGIGFLAAYILHFVIVVFLAHRLQGFRWQPLSRRLLGLHVLLASGLLVLSLAFPMTGALASIGLGITTALWGGHVVVTKIGPHGRLVSKVARVYELLGWPIRDVR
ncbi:MAG: oligosaccharide flippase family protein [Roseovarius sp.]|nr:oligosaccharide flippase family protein [Roseovarius sp.]